jgi:glycosyltransferase involved in cell wall biosynthesis
VGEPLGRQLNAHQILLIPSRWAEPFGNVALEGSACGCIPLGSDAGGLPDAIGPCGFVFRRNDLGHLVTQLRRLLLGPGLRQSLRSKAPIHLAAHRPVVVADRYLKIIEACG